MNQLHTLAAEIMAAVAEWLQESEEEKGKAIQEAVNRTSLQAGIHDLVYMQVEQGEFKLSTWISDYGSPEFERPIHPPDPPITRQQAETVLIPLLAEGIGGILQGYADNPLIDYHLQVSLELDDFGILPVLHTINERKRGLLLERIQTYIAKLENHAYPTDPLESFFLAQHLVDPLLFPELNSAFVLRIYELVMERNRDNPAKLKEHRGNFIRAFTVWVEEEFLPAYYHRIKPKWGVVEYTLKADVDKASIDQEHLELVLQTAILIIKYEPNYSRQRGLDLLARLQELGYAKAARVIKEGSGTLPADAIHYKDQQLECQAHDVFSTITIRIKEECADSYGKGLDYISNLHTLGFFRSYQIKLKSSVKQAVDVPGLAKSQTHRFFANALQYEELYPKLEAYARLAMVEFEWYEDTEGEKNCMPGTYAVFGLGLTDPRYYPLVQEYMKVVDSEHQSVQAAFTAAFIHRFGVDEASLPTITACLLACEDGKFTKHGPAFETASNLQALAGILATLEPYEARHIVELVWGSTAKLEKKAKAAKGELTEGFARVRDAVNQQ
ncbi:DUF6138 family protein [Paenibacillus sp. FSL R7-0302]|uniref:DUF6138 family protein n=1 Tax=Paenibacillus sp. FSL R7-0302 TaxID=2921681 RepID=UPI0030F620CB